MIIQKENSTNKLQQCIADCRSQSNSAYMYALIDPELSKEQKPTAVLFYPKASATDRFNNSRTGSTEKMVYVTSYGWRRVRFGAVFDWKTPTFYVELSHKRFALLYT
jgi:hypothetical protein